MNAAHGVLRTSQIQEAACSTLVLLLGGQLAKRAASASSTRLSAGLQRLMRWALQAPLLSSRAVSVLGNHWPVWAEAPFHKPIKSYTQGSHTLTCHTDQHPPAFLSPEKERLVFLKNVHPSAFLPSPHPTWNFSTLSVKVPLKNMIDEF